MTAIASWPLQVAVVSRLGSHASTSGYNVTDNKNASVPYVSVGATTAVEASNKTNDGSDETFVIHIWTAHSKDCKQYAANIDTALRTSKLDITSDGFTVLGVPLLDLFEVFEDSDPQTGDVIRHGVMRYRFMITNAT